jgi:hypothetical protein
VKHLVFTPDRNSPPDNDYTGAFKPESLRYAKYWRGAGDEVAAYEIDVSAARALRRAQVIAAISAQAPIDRLAVFCHGWRTGVQLGVEIGRELDALVAALAAASTEHLRIALYCCSTGRSSGPPGDGGDGSFADRLRDGLVAKGRAAVHVFSHASAGHTTRSGAVRLFVADGAAGGHDLTEVGSPERARLVARLSSARDPLRWTLPYLDLADALREVSP